MWRTRRKAIVRYFLVLFGLQLAVMFYMKSQSNSHIREIPETIRSRLFSRNHVMDYYHSHYESCQHSLVKENNISCRSLIDNTTTHPPFHLNLRRVCNFTKIIENCQLFRRINKYDEKFISREETNFPLVFGIRVHSSPHQVEQLLRIIYRPHNFYCIHVDNGSYEYVLNDIKAVARCFDNVVVLSKIRTVYSSIRLVEADLLCMKEAMKSSIKWKYFFNMAGLEIPLKTNLEMVRMCRLLNGRNDIESDMMDAKTADRIKYHYIVGKHHPSVTKIRKVPFEYNVVFRKGGAYGMLSRDFVQFAINSEVVHKLFEYLADTDAPEETFLSTLNYLPEAPGGIRKVVSHSQGTYLSRAVIWIWDRSKCHGTYIRGVCVFNSAALPWLTETPELIGNKVSSMYDQIVIDCLEEFLHNKSLKLDDQKLDATKYKRFPSIHQ